VRGPVDRLFPNLSHGTRVVVDWIVTIVFAVAIVLAVKAWIVNPYRIPSPSMEPTLHCARPEFLCEGSRSDRVLANRFIYHFRDPHRGEIVVFHAPRAATIACIGGIFVKRVIGLPGEVWAERNGYTYIDGKRLSEPYVEADRRDTTTTKTMRDIPPTGTLRRIPKGMYLMEGDNRAHSCDSRVWGLVPRSAIIGKVFFTYWPLGRIGVP
jgi:signal peptidase I